MPFTSTVHGVHGSALAQDIQEPSVIAELLKQEPWVLWVLGIVIVLKYVAQGLAETSDTAAKVLGPLGKKWRGRGQARREGEAADVASLKRQVEHLETRLNEVEADREVAIAYLEYDAQWHNRVRIWAAENGYTLPPPPHKTLSVFRQAWKV